MKRFSAVLLISVLMMCGVFAQKVETAASYPFDKPFGYWTEWEPTEGGMPFFNVTLVDQQYVFYAHSPITGYTYHLKPDGTYELGEKDKNFAFTCTQPINWHYGGIRIIGFQTTFNGVIWKYSLTMSDRKEPVEFESLVHCDYIYYTGKILFAEDANSHEMFSLEFLPDGSYTVRDVSETKAWLEDGKGEELGYIIDEWSSICFGDVDLSTVDNFYKDSCFKNAHEDEIIGAAFDALMSSRYKRIGKDSKGLIYLQKMQTENGRYRYGEPAKNITFDIAILDPWTKQVKYYEDYAPNEWNPPRDANGRVIGSYSWTVAPDGNIYFTDADVEKGEYQIKRVINRWWDDMGINDRIIGQMNTNHIPLLTTMNGSQNDGYCFENDFVWVTEQSKDKKWSKIKKIDGREGWVETKYIDINTMVPVTNASLGIRIDQSPAATAAVSAAKILKAADNLRLRKTELTSSEVITTMLKGTPVKIVATGRKETIDGITGNWVQVEVQSGGKDRNGTPIPAGTTGWCFGGYLE